MRRTLLVPLTCGLLAGCMGSRPSSPEAATVSPPAAWRTDPGMAGADVAPDWWRSLGDPVLADLVARALADNTDIAQAATRVAQADAQVRAMRGNQLPSLGIDFTGLPRKRSYSTTTGAGIEFTAYQAQLGASFDTDLFGKLRNQTRAAQAALLGSRAAQDAVRIAVVASVVSGYVGLRATDAAIEILQGTLASRRHQLALVTHQAAEGYVQQISVSQASAELHRVEQQLADAMLQQRKQEDALSVVLGDNPRAIPRGRALADLPLLAAPTGLPARMLRRRPDIAEAEQKIIAADRSLDAARAAFMPDLTLSANVGRLDADLLPNPLTIWSFTGSVLAPLFEGGKLRAQADIAAAKRDEAAFAYRAAALDAFREVEDALASLQQLAVKERAAEGARRDYMAALHAAQRRFDEGHSAYIEVLDAERGLLSAQSTLVQVRADRLTATVQLYQAMGGGWQPAVS